VAKGQRLERRGYGRQAVDKDAAAKKKRTTCACSTPAALLAASGVLRTSRRRRRAPATRTACLAHFLPTAFILITVISALLAQQAAARRPPPACHVPSWRECRATRSAAAQAAPKTLATARRCACAAAFHSSRALNGRRRSPERAWRTRGRYLLPASMPRLYAA